MRFPPLPAALRRFLAAPSAPLVLLAVLSVVSLGARSAYLGLPCLKPCTSASDHLLIFDEHYYVNAARVIDGIHPPKGQHYANAPLGDDPNSEHPQLAKLVIAGAIEVFGDGPFAWRVGSLLFGSLALLAMYALVVAAGGGRWLPLGAAALMTADNLLLVAGRIGTLDIYVLALMLAGAVLYLRERPLLAGAVIGVGTCMKLVAPYTLIVLALLELLRALAARAGPGGVSHEGPRSPFSTRAALIRLALVIGAAAVVDLSLLALLDALVPPWNPATGRVVGGGPFGHTLHMLRYADQLHGSKGIASYPWQWLFDDQPLLYSDVGLYDHAKRATVVRPLTHFLGFINPAILIFALPGLGLALWRVRRGLRGAGETDLIAIAWTLGTFAPFLLGSLLDQRTTYLYYMVIVMPGIYVLVARVLGSGVLPPWLVRVSIALIVLGAIVLYPFTPLPWLT